MSVREEHEQKICPSRGLGLSSVVVSVGVGTALHCYFSKGPENPDTEGSTSQGWRCEELQTLNNGQSEAAYTTEDSTTDTSDSDHSTSLSNNEISLSDVELMSNHASFPASFSDEESEESSITDFLTEDSIELVNNTTVDSFNEFYTDSELDQFADSVVAGRMNELVNRMTNSPLDRQQFHITIRLSNVVRMIQQNISDRLESREEQRLRLLQEQTFRERSWSLEECSICFEIMVKDQELMVLPCTHNFHTACIGPWLWEHQTCPMCRKAVE